MIKIFDNGARIECTKGDTFRLTVTADEATENSILQFIISASEVTVPIINENYAMTDGQFVIKLSDYEISALDIGDYIFKLALSKDGEIVTYLSGDLIVKWGA